MFELRYLRKIGRNGVIVDLQYRTKDRHVDSSTTTPLPKQWSEWANIPTVRENQAINNDSSLKLHIAKALNEIEERLSVLKTAVRDLDESDILSLKNLTTATHYIETPTTILRQKIDEFELENFPSVEN